MFQVTEAAAKQVKLAAQQGGTEGMALRLAAFRMADGRIDYKMGFDEIQDDDIQFRTHGVEVIMTPETVPLLDSAVMDFVKLEEGEMQFIFLNPLDPTYVPPQDPVAPVARN